MEDDKKLNIVDKALGAVGHIADGMGNFARHAAVLLHIVSAHGGTSAGEEAYMDRTQQVEDMERLASGAAFGQVQNKQNREGIKEAKSLAAIADQNSPGELGPPSQKMQKGMEGNKDLPQTNANNNLNQNIAKSNTAGTTPEIADAALQQQIANSNTAGTDPKIADAALQQQIASSGSITSDWKTASAALTNHIQNQRDL